MFALRSKGSLLARSHMAGRRGALNTAMRATSTSKIIYTGTDEAPALATYSLLPIIDHFAGKIGVEVEKKDISLAARIISQFPKYLTDEQRIPDNLALLGEMCTQPDANVIKLPNISASLPQLEAAITELRTKGYDIPMYVAEPKTEKERVIHSRYAKVIGSAVNPVLREGNSDRRVAAPVKNYAKKNPHQMGAWSKASRSHVAFMEKGDFYASEKSHIAPENTTLKIELVKADGSKMLLKESVAVDSGDVVDASFMSVKELRAFFEKEIQEAFNDHMLISLHMKATMMKVSDPVIFGHCVEVFYKDVFEKHADTLAGLNVNPSKGFQDLLDKIKLLPEVTKAGIEKDIEECYQHRPWVAMVNSDKGITNFHVPNDIIIDASMPVVVRDSGKMWNKDNELEDVKCMIPDRCYATMYNEIISFCKQYNQFDVSEMGSVANVGLMAKKAEEYGSHDKTFILPDAGTVTVTNAKGEVIFEHAVETGDIWRMAQTKDESIKDWVKLAVNRSRLSDTPAIFWLDDHRAHDRNLIEKVKKYLPEHDTTGLDISVNSPVHAIRLSCERAKEGKDTISVTGNVLRDYLTDLFPILELGTSSKMLSIVPLLNGGGLFETGAGGSAPKHVQQFVNEGHLRWDSLGEYLALAVSFEHLGQTQGNKKALQLGEALNKAIEHLLENRKSPSRRVNELDNRASNFYLALYWANFMAEVDPDFVDLAQKLQNARPQIVAELKMCQGKQQDIGGYYQFDEAKVANAMRPSPTFNKIIENN